MVRQNSIGGPGTAEIAVLAVLFISALSFSAGAQQAEQITVVGTGATGQPASTTVLGATGIARSGTNTIGALLDQLPAFGSQGVNGAQNDGGFGEYFVDLRNLNFDRTLVLVDGQRFVLSGIQTDEAVDLNDIPAAFVDHIEVLADGTHPQYGPDAVAGVVNVVLKDQVEGIHLDTYGAAAGAGDAGTTEVSLTGGHDFGDGHVAIGLDAYRRDPVLQSDRPWSANPIASAALTPAGPDILHGSTAAPGGHAVGDGIDSLALGGGRSAPYDAATDYYNPAGRRYLQAGLQRETVYADADRAMTDSTTANIELLYTDRTATTLQPPQTLGLTGTDKHPDGFVIPAADPFNPFAKPVTLERVVTEAGAQQTTTSGPVWRVLGGLDGLLGSWAWSASFNHGQSLSHYATDNEIDLTRALQTAGAAACPLAAGCMPANWFGPDSLSRQALHYIRYTGRSQSAYTESVGQAHVTGPVFGLPGGQARLTLGAEMRSVAGATNVDYVTARGDQSGDDAAPTDGGYESYDIYAALAAPLLRNLSYAKALDLSLTARESATTRYGSFPTLRASLDYAPSRGLHLFATSGTAQRPPAISEAFGGITSSLQPVSDPCAQRSGLRANPVVDSNCRAQGLGPGFTQNSPLVDVLSGGNPSLHPEQSENETLGVNFEPPALPWLSLKADWYDYRITDAIDSLADTDPNLIPDICYASARLSSPLCALITRFTGGGNAGQISSILGRDENVGTIKTDGLDFDSVAAFETGEIGQVKFDWQTNWLLNYRLHTLGQPGFTQYAGTFPGLSNVGLFARVRSRATLDWLTSGWDFAWTGRFLSGGRVLGASSAELFRNAPDTFYQDVAVSKQLGRLTVLAGIDNIADTRPPTLVDGQTNTDTSTYDVVGRFMWARVVYRF
jgi:outer membrane receptor protein involved in Fe transport